MKKFLVPIMVLALLASCGGKANNDQSQGKSDKNSQQVSSNPASNKASSNNEGEQKSSEQPQSSASQLEQVKSVGLPMLKTLLGKDPVESVLDIDTLQSTPGNYTSGQGVLGANITAYIDMSDKASTMQEAYTIGKNALPAGYTTNETPREYRNASNKIRYGYATYSNSSGEILIDLEAYPYEEASSPLTTYGFTSSSTMVLEIYIHTAL